MSERNVLKGFFNTGDVPTEAQFADLIDSFGIDSFIDPTLDSLGAVGDGTTVDTTPMLNSADAAKAANKNVLVRPDKIFRVVGAASPVNGHYVFPIRANHIGVNPKGSVIRYESAVGDNRGLYVGSEASGRLERLDIINEDMRDPVNQPRVAINNQAAGLDYFTTTTAADASLFIVGRYIKIGVEHSEYDADDGLWKHQIMAKITGNNGTTGVVNLDRNIPFPLYTPIWDGTEYPDYAPGAFTAGDRVYNSSLELYQAVDSGTAVAASPQLDGTIGSVTVTNGGSGYPDTGVAVRAYMPIDGTTEYMDLGQMFTVTVSGGAITSVTKTGTTITGYNSSLVFEVFSPNGAGSGAVLTPVISGIRWKKLSNSIGALPKSMDFSPCAQMMADDMLEGLTMKNLTIEAVSDIVYLLAARNQYKATFENIVIKGALSRAFEATEGSTDIVFRNVVMDATTGSVNDDTHSRVGGFYGANNILLDGVVGVCGKNAEARALYIENNTTLTCINSKFFNRVPNGMNAYGVLMDGGSELTLLNTEFYDFPYPIRKNVAAYQGYTRRGGQTTFARYKKVEGNTFHGMDAKNFRTVGERFDSCKVFNQTNFYPNLRGLHNSGNISHGAQVDFFPFDLITIYEQFEPNETDDETFFNVGPYVYSPKYGTINLHDFHFVFLAQHAYYSDAPVASCAVRTRGFNSGTERWIISGTGATSYTTVSNRQIRARLEEGNGDGIRYFHPGKETLQYEYFFNGTNGGIVELGFDVLIAERID